MNTSLTQVSGFVSNAFAIESLIAFEPEDIRLDVYTFLPWVRSGLGSIVQAPDAGSTRPRVTIGVSVEDDKGGSQIVEKTLTVRGPGDVLAVDPSQIIRRYPTPGSVDAEETFLAHIEFDRPELPWLFTPFPPGGPDESRLDPWLTLVVLERAHVRFEPSPPGMPRRVRTRMAELQPLTDPWAFAHAQVSND
ncbi:MAG: hypothetical protein KDA28_05000, partial [Phycisphaerales bacterium]|nr:hypothetical protein [Phycisphaerales bacterium]